MDYLQQSGNYTMLGNTHALYLDLSWPVYKEIRPQTGNIICQDTDVNTSTVLIISLNINSIVGILDILGIAWR